MKNTSHIKRIALLLCTIIIAVISTLLLNPLTVQAKTSLVQAIVDSIGNNTSAGNQSVQNGISQYKRG